MVIATTTSNVFAQQLVQDTIMVVCWSLQKSSYIVLPSPLSLDILEWHLDQPTTQRRKQTCAKVPQTPSFSTIIQEYTACLFLHNASIQYVQVRGGLVLVHTNTQLYEIEIIYF